MMPHWQIWLLILMVGLTTYAFRLGFILLSGRGGDEVSPLITRILSLIPAAVFAALIAPQILLVPGSLEFSLANERLWASLAALIVAWRTSSMGLTIATGMVSLWVLQWLISGSGLGL